MHRPGAFAWVAERLQAGRLSQAHPTHLRLLANRTQADPAAQMLGLIEQQKSTELEARIRQIPNAGIQSRLITRLGELLQRDDRRDRPEIAT